jgi:hypothetical protein
MLTFQHLYDTVMAGPVTFAYWKGEVGELWDEVKTFNLAGIREEWSDVVCLGMLHLLTVRGWPVGNIPILPGLGLYAANKFTARNVVWAKIFAHHERTFERRYIIGGGNYRKLTKVIAALSLAGIESRDVDTGWIQKLLDAERSL